MRNCSESSEGSFCSSSYLCEGAHFQRNIQCVNYAQSNYCAGHWKFTPNWMLLKQTSQFTRNTEVQVKRKCIMDFCVSVTHTVSMLLLKKNWHSAFPLYVFAFIITKWIGTNAFQYQSYMIIKHLLCINITLIPLHSVIFRTDKTLHWHKLFLILPQTFESLQSEEVNKTVKGQGCLACKADIASAFKSNSPNCNKTLNVR